MLVRAVNGSMVIVENGGKYLYYAVGGKGTDVLKDGETEMIAAITKWGYHRVKPPVKVSRLEDIDLEVVERNVEIKEFYL